MVEKNNSSFFLLLIAVFFISSCNKDGVYSKMYDLNNSTWDQSNILSYNFNIQDTVHAHHVFFNVRHSSKYEYKNLYLFIETTSPTGNTVKDTLEITLADNKGRWYGKGWGDIFEVKTPYKKYVRFPNAGTYSMEIQQAMRTPKLKHVSDFGIQIKKAKTPLK